MYPTASIPRNILDDLGPLPGEGPRPAMERAPLGQVQPGAEVNLADFSIEGLDADDPQMQYEAEGDTGGAGQSDEMSEDEVLSACEAMEKDAVDYMEQEASLTRAKIMEYFFGLPFGNEEEGRSEAISSDVMDGLLGMMPGLTEPFVSSDDVVMFRPTSAKDEDAAEQETAYLNRVLEKNGKYALIYNWIFDGISQINGVVHYYWDEVPKVRIERYKALTEAQLVEVLNHDDVTVLEQNKYDHPRWPQMLRYMQQQYQAQQQQQQQQAMQAGMPPQPPAPFQPPQPIQVYDLVLRYREGCGQPRVVNVPPEEFIISSDARDANPKNARMCGRRREISLSQLVQMGFDVDEEALDTDGDVIRNAPEYLARNANALAAGDLPEDKSGASKMVVVRDLYPLLDVDGDGIAERRRIMYVGKQILLNEEFEEPPFSAWTPYPIPHRYQGVCPGEMLMDIQLQKSAFQRAMFDNAYTINNNRTLVAKGVNPDDLMNNPVGGYIRVNADQVTGKVEAMNTLPIIDKLLPLVQYLDAAKESRTGHSKESAGLNAEALANMTAFNGAEMMDAARARTKMVARTFAETGLKDLMVSLHGLVRRNGQGDSLQIGEKWIDVDPRFWRNRQDMTVSVGLGTGSRSEKLQALQMIGAAQKEALAMGLTNPEKIYNTLVESTKAMGYKNVHKFWIDPKSPDYKPPEQQKPELVQAEEAKGAAALQREKVKASVTMSKTQADNTNAYAITLLQQAVKALIEATKDDGGAAERQALEPQQNEVRREVDRVGPAGIFQ